MNLNSPSSWLAGSVGVHEDAFAAILLLADGNEIAGADASHFANPEHAVAIDDERGVHARLAREPPFASDADVGRKIRRRKEVFGQHAVGRRRNEASVRRRRKRGALKSG